MAHTSTQQALGDLFDVIFRDRIPRSPQFDLTPTAVRQFGVFSDAFDSSEPISLVETIAAPTQTDDWTLWRTNKMKYARSDRSAIRFNDYIELSQIPEHAHTVRLGQLTLVDWVLDRCQLVKDPSSGRTIFDPNDISRRHGCPRLVADFLATTIAASCSAAHQWTGDTAETSSLF
jgi:predicted helicase